MWPFGTDDAVHNPGREFRGNAFGGSATGNSVSWIDRLDPRPLVHADFVGCTDAAARHVRGSRPRGVLRNRADLSAIAIHRHQPDRTPCLRRSHRSRTTRRAAIPKVFEG